MAVITLLTDFGTRDAYVAAMKGVILQLAPDATLVDITHQVAPQDVAEGAFALAACWRYFPDGTVHLAVVDPGVGSARRGIAIAAEGHYFVGPDNGLFSMALAHCGTRRIVALENARLFRHPVSHTFHGRDIFAPVAALLSRGMALTEAGPEVADMVLLPQAAPRRVGPGEWEGEVLAVDRFGNLITNVRGEGLAHEKVRVMVGGLEIRGVSRCYADVDEGALLALVGSSGFLEVAVNRGSAARLLKAERGTPVRVRVEHPAVPPT
ncbi:MAG: SAM-dependent chlorinase/fluorinase [Armatimonadota bacterium]|nr:SAM-dependent chlorinase/fluorinase [Armatimonadota bacterium]